MRNKITPFHFMLLLAFAITFSVVINVGFATNDDYEYFYRYYNDTNVWKSSLLYAKMNGRFYFVFMQPLFNVLLPHFTGSVSLTNFIQVLLIIGGAFLFARNLSLLLKSEKIGYLFLIVYCAFISFKTTNNPVTSYPFYFSTAWILFQLSLFYFLKWTQEGISKHRLFSAAFFLAALLFYEMFLIYLLVFAVIFLINRKDNDSIISKISDALRYHLIGCAGYVLAYFIFKKFYSLQLYDGVNVSSSFNPLSTIYTLFMFIKGALPLHHYFSNVNVYRVSSEIPGGHVQSILTPFIHIKIEWVVKSCLLGACMFYFAYSQKERDYIKSNKRHNLLLILLCISFIVIPNILIALTQKYQELASMGADYYISTYFVVFPLYSIIAILIWHSVRITNKVVKQFATIFLITLVMLCSVLMDYANSYVKTDLGKVHKLFTSIDKLVENPVFISIAKQPDAIFSSADLYEVNAALSYYNIKGFDISEYFEAKSGNKFMVLRDSTYKQHPQPDKKHYSIYYRNYPSGNYFMFSGDSITHLFVSSSNPEVEIVVNDQCFIQKFNHSISGKNGYSHIAINKTLNSENIQVRSLNY